MRRCPTVSGALAVAHVMCLLDELEGSAAHLEVNALPPRLRGQIVAKRDHYERGVRALVVAGIRAGTLHAADATIATRAFLGALNWTAQWFRPDGAKSPEQIAAAGRRLCRRRPLQSASCTQPSETP